MTPDGRPARACRRAPVALVVLAVLAAGCSPAGDPERTDDADPDAIGERLEMVAEGASFVEDEGCFGVDLVGLEDDDVRCGRVEVPLEAAEPDGEQIDLAVAVLDPDAADGDRPLLVLGGGPGEVMVETALTEPVVQRSYQTGRPTIVVDQRGVGHSRPALDCPDIDDDALQGTADEDLEIMLEQVADCRDGLTDEGIDLGAFHHRANAIDVHAVRAALGHDEIDLRGTSYGTHVALHAAALDPDRVGALVLSSPIDPTGNYLQAAAGGFQRALDRVAVLCAADETCAREIGDLDQALTEAVERLDDEPVEVTVAPSDGEETTLTVTPSTFLSGLFSLFYLPDGAFVLPALIDRARDGDVEQLAELQVRIQQQLEEAIAVGMHLSMVCTAEGAHFDVDAALEGVTSQVLVDHWFEHGMTGGAATQRTCETWAVDAEVAAGQIELPRDVPALVVTGGFDHVTPPELGEAVADGLSTAHLVEVPIFGHGPLEGTDLLADGCGRQLVSEFLADPQRAPDTACLDRLPPYQPLTELPQAPL